MPIRILHAHSTFTLGGKEARAVQIMNDLGDAAEHVVLSAVPGALGARAAIDPAIRVSFPEDMASCALHAAFRSGADL
jgi:L-malate glycosyltransferase